MRKSFYYITLCAVSLVLILNAFSQKQSDWLIAKYEPAPHIQTTVFYGLTQRCERTIPDYPQPPLPPPGNGNDTTPPAYETYSCRTFPASVTDGCDGPNKKFCAGWTSANYLDQVAIGQSAVAFLAILFGVTTHSRRRRIWRALATLIFVQTACQIATFALVTDLYVNKQYPGFEYAQIGSSYVMHTVAWVFNIFVIYGVVHTGIAADKGRVWAAGGHAYEPIP